MGKELSDGSTTFEILAAGGQIIHVNERVASGPANPIQRNEPGDSRVKYWGDDNLYPQTLNTWIEKHPILSSKLPWLAMAIASGGVMYGKKTANGFEPGYDPEVEKFLKAINIKRYNIDLPIEVIKFYNGFVELIPTVDRRRIALVVPQDSTFCRLSRLDYKELQGKPRQCYINGDWDKGDSWQSAGTSTHEVIDHYGDRIAQIREGSAKSYIYHIAGPGSGRDTYAEAPWTSALKSKWLEYSLAIPEAKLAKITNAMMVLIHIEVPHTYWKAAYPDWEEKKDLQAARKQEKQTEWTKVFTDKTNWGKTVMTSYKDYLDGKTGEHIKFKVLENPFKETELIEDSFEANAQIFQAIGMDATLNGTIPGKSMGAGSGSDKREAWNLLMLSSKPMQDLFLEPLQFVFDYNGFDYELVYKNYFIATQDQVAPDKRNQNDNPANPA